MERDRKNTSSKITNKLRYYKAICFVFPLIVLCVTITGNFLRMGQSTCKHLLRGGYKRGLNAFQGGKRHHGRFGASEGKKRGGGSNHRSRASTGDVILGHALRQRCRSCLVDPYTCYMCDHTHACAPTATYVYLTTVCVLFCYFSFI